MSNRKNGKILEAIMAAEQGVQIPCKTIWQDLERIEGLLKIVEDIDERMAYETGSAGAYPEIREMKEILKGL
jgi:hypothetical protein